VLIQVGHVVLVTAKLIFWISLLASLYLDGSFIISSSFPLLYSFLKKYDRIEEVCAKIFAVETIGGN
jgi:hypothetical protein